MKDLGFTQTARCLNTFTDKDETILVTEGESSWAKLIQIIN